MLTSGIKEPRGDGMAATETEGMWIHRQAWREERLRYEVLKALYEKCQGQSGRVMRVAGFGECLGVWPEELFRGVEFLDRHGYVTYHGAGPEVSITSKGVEYLERKAARRRSIRD
jgi:Mn-dependent DtxR family transcriptional regulator